MEEHPREGGVSHSHSSETQANTGHLADSALGDMPDGVDSPRLHLCVKQGLVFSGTFALTEKAAVIPASGLEMAPWESPSAH